MARAKPKTPALRYPRTAEDCDVGARVRWRQSPLVLQPEPTPAPSCVGLVTVKFSTAHVFVRFAVADGFTSPMPLVPGQPCEVIP